MLKALKALGFRGTTAILAVVVLAPIPGIGWMLGTHVMLKYVVDTLYPVGGGPLDGGDRYDVELEWRGQTFVYERLVQQEKDHLESAILSAKNGKPQMLDRWTSEFVRP